MEGVRCEQAVDRVVSQSYIIRKKPQRQFNCHVYDVYLQQRMMHMFLVNAIFTNFSSKFKNL